MSLKSISVERQEQIGRTVVLAILLALPGWLCLRSPSVVDPDIWWHLRSGEWILQHHSFPQTDPFSIYGANKPWEAYSWLYEILVLKLFRQWSLMGLVAYTTAMVIAVTAALQSMLQRLQADFTKATLLTVAAVIPLSRLFTPRPWLFTILFFVLEANILLYARETGRKRVLLWLPVIFALWANIHVQFIDGLVLLGVATAEPLAERWWPYRQTRLRFGTIGTVFATSIAATLLNPYGIHIYRIAYDLASQSGVTGLISELQSIQFRSFGDYLIVFLPLAAVGAMAWRRRFPFFESALLAFGIITSFRSVRDVWIVIVAATAILASFFPHQGQQGRRLPAFALVPVGLITLLLLWLGSLVYRVNEAELRNQLAQDMPVKAVEVVKSKGYSGPLFNDFNWGGFLIWNLRQPVCIDGRTAFYGDEQIERSAATWNAQPDWASDSDLGVARLVIAPVKTPLTQLLRQDPDFSLTYEDKLAAVFVRRR
jgi:hypothetical protein